jgi:sodium/hydrogen antiporter
VQLSDLLFALFGVGALLAGILPRVLERRPLSMPIAFLALGMLVFALPLGLPDPSPLAHPKLTEHLTEIGVIVALMGAGLKIDRPLSRRAWASTWRLLAVAMPVTIAAMAFLGWW